MKLTHFIHFLNHVIMTKLEALTRTQKKFTNLIDGKVLSNASVIDIIIYYEALVDLKPVKIEYQSLIEKNFLEEEYQEMFNEADYWDDDGTNHFSYGC
jgi:hypothetical protein